MSPVLTAPIVSTQWVADHLGADDLVVVDASVLVTAASAGGGRSWQTGHEAYLLDGHVPGAVFADLPGDFSDTSSPLPFTRPGESAFEEAVGALGISNDTCVVVYDSSRGQWAARLWWLFHAFGYDDVAVLDGGWSAWRSEERPYDLGAVEPGTADFVAEERPDAWADKAFVEDVVAGREDAALVCALPPAEFSGSEGHWARPGHIPGSANVPLETLVDDSRRFRRTAELRTALGAAAGAGRVVVYCGAGVQAAADALALTLVGHTRVSVYDGSLAEWAADPAAPLDAPAAA